jgi:hypothetical protein
MDVTEVIAFLSRASSHTTASDFVWGSGRKDVCPSSAETLFMTGKRFEFLGGKDPYNFPICAFSLVALDCPL